MDVFYSSTSRGLCVNPPLPAIPATTDANVVKIKEEMPPPYHTLKKSKDSYKKTERDDIRIKGDTDTNIPEKDITFMKKITALVFCIGCFAYIFFRILSDETECSQRNLARGVESSLDSQRKDVLRRHIIISSFVFSLIVAIFWIFAHLTQKQPPNHTLKKSKDNYKKTERDDIRIKGDTDTIPTEKSEIPWMIGLIARVFLIAISAEIFLAFCSVFGIRGPAEASSRSNVRESSQDLLNKDIYIFKFLVIILHVLVVLFIITSSVFSILILIRLKMRNCRQ